MVQNIVDFAVNGEFYYNLGVKFTQSRNFLKALEYFRRAVDLQPYNLQFNFSLAGTLAELNNTEECIFVLENTMKNVEVSAEFYFALGCNNFNICEYDKAYNYLKRYILLSPNGEFAEEAFEAINFIEDNFLKKEYIENSKYEKTIDKAKIEIERGNYNIAIRLLRNVLKLDPFDVIAYNNLALAYYMCGKVETAIHLSRKVLKIDPKNSYANTNLALFYKTLGNEDFYQRKLQTLKKLEYKSKEEIINVVTMVSKWGEIEYLKSFLDRVTLKHDDAILIHFKAIAYYNVGNFNKAKEIWISLREREQYLCILIDCFLFENSKAKSSYPNYPEMSYDINMFNDYVVRIEELVKSLINSDYSTFELSWNNNVYVSEIVNYCLYKLKIKDRLKLLNNLATMEDETAILMLDRYVKNCNSNDEVKQKCETILRYKMAVGDNVVNFSNFFQNYVD